MNNKPLIAIHEGKYYRRGDGIALGPGLFIKGLEYVATTKALLVGKPNAKFYEGAIPEGISKEECVMIGDVCIYRYVFYVFLSIGDAGKFYIF